MSEQNSIGATGGVRMLLRLEGAALLLGAVFFYARSGAPWQPFAILFLAPDLAFVFYLAGARAGAFAYNITHSTIGPIVLALLTEFGVSTHTPIWISFIWLAHVGFDRALGYGLKYASSFGDTHLGAIGKQRRLAAESAIQ